MPEESANTSSLALILVNLADLKADIKGIESKVDAFARQTERHDAQIDMLNKQITQFVPMNVLDERRSAFDKRMSDVEHEVHDIQKKQEDKADKNVTRGLAVLAIVVSGIMGWFNYSHQTQSVPATTTTTSITTSHSLGKQ